MFITANVIGVGRRVRVWEFKAPLRIKKFQHENYRPTLY